ncbi:transmembrane protein 53-A [Mustelus asterias]
MSLSESAPQNMMVKRLSNTITLYRNSVKMVDDAPRPLLLLLPWFGAKPHVVERYRQIYYQYGFDILTVESKLLHFLWPQYGLSYASEVLDLLHSESLSSHPLIIHAFSIGGFLVAQIVGATLRDTPPNSGFKARIRGQIFDSLVVGDVELMAKGVAQMLVPPFLQPFFKWATLFYFWFFKSYTVRHYQTSIQAFKETPYHTPILTFYSENDPLSDYNEVEAMLRNWCGKDIQVTGKSWKISRHAGHLRHHPLEYQSTLENFLQSLGMTHVSSKL